MVNSHHVAALSLKLDGLMRSELHAAERQAARDELIDLVCSTAVLASLGTVAVLHLLGLLRFA